MSEPSREPRNVGEPQNIYDDPKFFAGYSTLERFGAGWNRAMEHAELLGLLPDVGGRRVLDLGCGGGQLAHHLATRGAAEVTGVDVSERMLAPLINGVLDAWLVLERHVEPMPGEQWLRDHPQAADERRRPMFLLVRARKA